MTSDPTPVADSRLLKAQAEAAAFFAQRLHSPAGADPRDYLAGRGLLPAVGSGLWDVGYAPPAWTELTDHLRSRGFGDDEICASGLGLRTRRGTVVDRFRDRITLGVHDEYGTAVAFIARAAPGAVDAPKYLNSPRSATYDKSAVLFGLGEQRDLLEDGAIPVLVEGPFDAMAVSLASAPEGPTFVGLAACGTALTDAHVRALNRVTSTPPLVAFDADPAGGSAATRACVTLGRATRGPRAVLLTPGQDPASILAEGGTAKLRSALKTSVPLADLVVDLVLTKYADRLDNAEARLCALREVAPTVASLTGSDVARQAAGLGSTLDLDYRTVARELTEAASARFRPQPTLQRRHPQTAPLASPAHPRLAELGATRTSGGRAR